MDSTYHGRHIAPEAVKKNRRPRRSIPSQRSALEIVGDVLLVCADGGAKKTRIMYRANMSHEMLRHYLPMLLMRGLLAKSPDAVFKVTHRGTDYLESYVQLKSLMQ